MEFKMDISSKGRHLSTIITVSSYLKKCTYTLEISMFKAKAQNIWKNNVWALSSGHMNVQTCATQTDSTDPQTMDSQ